MTSKTISKETHGSIVDLYCYGLPVKMIADYLKISTYLVYKDLKATNGVDTREDRFWDNTELVWDCWIWKGATSKEGFGITSYHGKRVFTHRLAWELKKGAIPDGYCVLHTCQNNACIYIGHLYLGLRPDSQGHKKRKPYRKLSPDSVIAIRRMIKEGKLTQRELAFIYDVTTKTVSNIVNRKTWRNLL